MHAISKVSSNDCMTAFHVEEYWTLGTKYLGHK